MEKTDKKFILVTGYGPFGKHKINASWEAVKRLPEHFKHEQVSTFVIGESLSPKHKRVD